MLITSGGLKNLIDRAMVIYCRKRASIHQETVPEAKTRLTLKNSSISVELTAWEVKAMSENDIAEDSRKVYIRPLIASLFFAVAGEFLLLVIYGIISLHCRSVFGNQSNFINHSVSVFDNGYCL
jgi:hypothetical protein